MTNLDYQQIISSGTTNQKYFYKNNVEKFEKKEISDNPGIDQIKQQWKAFLETKNLIPETYNQQCVKKRSEKIKSSILRNAKNKKELSLLIEAKQGVEKAISKVKQKHPEFVIEREAEEFLTLELFEKLKL